MKQDCLPLTFLKKVTLTFRIIPTKGGCLPQSIKPNVYNLVHFTDIEQKVKDLRMLLHLFLKNI